MQDTQLFLMGLDDAKQQKIKRRKIEDAMDELQLLHQKLNQLCARPSERPSVHSPADMFDLVNPFIGSLDYKELWVINLDTRNRVMCLVKLYKGSVNSSQVRVAEVFRQAMIDNSPAIIVAHNHPTGDPAPSQDDVAVTYGIVQAGKLLDIDVLDHIIIAGGRFISLKERGLGFT